MEPELPTVPAPLTWRQKLAPWFEGLGGEPTVILCGASAALIASHYQGNTGFFRVMAGTRFDAHPWSPALGFFWWFFSSVGFYLVIPLLISLATRGSFHNRYGFGLGDWRAGLKITGLFLIVMLPAVWVAAQLPSFKGMYPLAGNSAFMANVAPGKSEKSWSLFISYELAYFSYFIAWEFLFRGWMVNGILPKWGRGPAILAQVAPFAVMHLGKAELEAMGSIVAGVALGILAIRTRSFWYGAVLHGVIALWMDWLSAKALLLGA